MSNKGPNDEAVASTATEEGAAAEGSTRPGDSGGASESPAGGAQETAGKGDPKAPQTVIVTEADVKVRQVLEMLARSLDEILAEEAGERYGFALFVFPLDRAQAAGSYICNSHFQGVASAVRAMLDRIEKNRGVAELDIIPRGLLHPEKPN